ncbi:MAG: AAA family ATPase, partial [Promethearchaeota archaeon]
MKKKSITRVRDITIQRENDKFKEQESGDTSEIINSISNPPKVENKKVIMPISQKKLKYNVYFPTEDQQIYYPMLEFKGYEDKNINELELIRLAIERDRSIPSKNVTTFYFFSPPGLGKTVMGAYMAACYNSPFQIVNCVNSMIDLDMLGSQILQGEDTLWQDGPLPSIIRATNEFGFGILIINELNALTVNAQMALNPLLDRQECVVLTQNNNEMVKIKAPNHLLILASMNPDVFGIHDLQDSVRDRASAILEMSYPPLEKEIQLIQCLSGISQPLARKYCEVISECRKAKYKDKTISKAPSTRALLDWINYSGVWGPMLAFQMTIANRYCSGYSAEEREILLRLAKGKGVKLWKIEKESVFMTESTEYDEFHFPSMQPIRKKVPAKRTPNKNLNKTKKTSVGMRKLQKAADQLKLSKLDSFMATKSKKGDITKKLEKTTKT